MSKPDTSDPTSDPTSERAPQPLYGQPSTYDGWAFAQCGWIDSDGDLYRLDDAIPSNVTQWPVYRAMGRTDWGGE